MYCLFCWSPTVTGHGTLMYYAASLICSGPVKIGLLTVATTDQIPSLTGYAPLVSPTFTGARIVLWPRIGNEYNGFGMNGSTLNYSTPSSSTHKLHYGTAVCASTSSCSTTFNQQCYLWHRLSNFWEIDLYNPSNKRSLKQASNKHEPALLVQTLVTCCRGG